MPSGIYPRNRTAVERFDARWTPEPNSGCWLWIAGTNPDTGYGMFWYKGKMQSAPRVAWKLFKGDIPEGMCVLHRCDVRACVNPNHLFLGDKMDNFIDAKKKGRMKPPPIKRKKLTCPSVSV